MRSKAWERSDLGFPTFPTSIRTLLPSHLNMERKHHNLLSDDSSLCLGTEMLEISRVEAKVDYGFGSLNLAQKDC